MQELFAQSVHAAELSQVLLKINYYIINPVIRLMFALAVVVFMWGVIQYVLKKDSVDAKAQGRVHMMWGLIGLFIMTSVFFIIKFLVNTFGLDGVQVNDSTNSIDVQIGEVQVQ